MPQSAHVIGERMIGPELQRSLVWFLLCFPEETQLLKFEVLLGCETSK